MTTIAHDMAAVLQECFIVLTPTTKIREAEVRSPHFHEYKAENKNPIRFAAWERRADRKE